ncbi:pancreatic progenitor cell differentiation and proliferation factor B-like [Gouania willdenowi]|uniref:Pancreatic progenitor cell differentiation and proliferation factor B-like n=1 Tax=Gouania willdenowi TaxID=441366 RepID=A0A8C5GML8_GOUWI|nr:pancreatic progenitor cell differentiation and proliferation factor B-like [Gouania willdenowi]
MASIPAGGSLVATTGYYRRRIGSTSSSSSCGSSDYSGEVIPHHPGLPKQDSGHWWSSFFFGKQPGMTPLTEEAQQKAGATGTVVTNGQITCVAQEMVMQRQASESSEAGSPTTPSSLPLTATTEGRVTPTTNAR